MKKSAVLLVTLLAVMGFFLVPTISSADPGNGDGNGNAGGNGNHYGWHKGNDDGDGNSRTQQVPEPLILFLLGSSLAGLAVIKRRVA